MRSSLQTWHVGKVIMLWAWGIALMLVTVDVLAKLQNPVLGFFLIGIFIGIPLALSVLTWRWLSGKERS